MSNINKAMLLAGVLCSSLAWSNTERVADNQLTDLFEGKDIFFDMRDKDQAQGWDSAHFRFLEQGNMIGYLFSADFLSTKTPSSDVDNGIWEIRNNMICIQWSQWENSAENCYAIYLDDNAYIAKSDSQGLFKGEFDPQY